jgi:hypothetical protein
MTMNRYWYLGGYAGICAVLLGAWFVYSNRVWGQDKEEPKKDTPAATAAADEDKKEEPKKEESPTTPAPAPAPDPICLDSV